MTAKWASVREARELILSRVTPVTGGGQVPLRELLGRVLSEDVIAPFDVPGFDNSAMDGYACRADDFSSDGSASLIVSGSAFAGAPAAEALQPGQCARIMTGARVPENADIVVPQEETEVEDKVEDKRVTISPGSRKVGMHIRRAGEDLQKGGVALSAGTLCMSAEIGLLGSLGAVEARARRRVRVAFFSTGDEVKTAGMTLQAGEVYDSNRHSIYAMLRRMHVDAIDLGVVPDNPEVLAETMDIAMSQADVIIASGGASVGEADFIRPVLAQRGETVFWKVSMRPGRPLAYGRLGDSDFFGLPGNPVSVMVCFYQFVRPALWKRAGRIDSDMPPLFSAVVAAPLKKSPGREEYQRGILSVVDGVLRVSPTGEQGSGILSSMTRANCFIVLEESRGAVSEGETVQVQIFEGLV